MNYKPTQLDLAESARRRVANKAKAIMGLMESPDRPTKEELKKLRSKRPSLWNSFPENNCIDA